MSAQALLETIRAQGYAADVAGLVASFQEARLCDDTVARDLVLAYLERIKPGPADGRACVSGVFCPILWRGPYGLIVSCYEKVLYIPWENVASVELK